MARLERRGELRLIRGIVRPPASKAGGSGETTITWITATFGRFIEYNIASGIGSALHLAVLFTLTEVFGVWYLISVAAGFVTSTILVFILHKFWTFHDNRTAEAPRQAWLFSLVEFSSLLLHLGGVYALVEWLGLWYGLAQVIVMVVSTFYTFLTKKFLIFNR